MIFFFSKSVWIKITTSHWNWSSPIWTGQSASATYCISLTRSDRTHLPSRTPESYPSPDTRGRTPAVHEGPAVSDWLQTQSYEYHHADHQIIPDKSLRSAAVLVLPRVFPIDDMFSGTNLQKQKSSLHAS